MTVRINQQINTYCGTNMQKGVIQEFDAYGMSDVYKILNDIVGSGKNYALGRPLWFRGQSYEHFMLLPSLYRNRKNSQNESGYYSMISLAEEYRHQNFSARVNHLTNTNPKNRVEWQELLQHHFGKTRFMDWSESIKTAVNFALEAFIDTKDVRDNRYIRSTATPVIWVMDPYRLNEHTYEFFANEKYGKPYIKKAIKNLFEDDEADKAVSDIQEQLRCNKEIYFNFGDEKQDIAINGIVSVCTLDNYYHDNIVHMKHMLKHYEFNPFFYLLVRYYADALPVDADVNAELLPPLASIQPYHSERIRAQRGTFAIFPNYCRTEAAQCFAGTKMDVVPIESQKGISDCFYKIRLCDPVKAAKELIYAGERRTEVYPDIQVYADYLETSQFFL